MQVIITQPLHKNLHFQHFFITIFFFFRPFPFNSINVTEKKPVGEIIAKVKATDRDENSSITYSLKTQQEMFGLDPRKF